MGNLKELFHGISVVIDDEIDSKDKDTEIDQLIKTLEHENCYVVKFKKIPALAAAKNLEGASLFILDWNFHPVSSDQVNSGVRIPDVLQKKYETANIAFIKEIKKLRFEPIFIFTNESVDYVRRKLKNDKLINEDDGDHIFVKNKKDVL